MQMYGRYLDFPLFHEFLTGIFHVFLLYKNSEINRFICQVLRTLLATVVQEAHGVAIDMVGKLVKVWINELGLGKIGATVGVREWGWEFHWIHCEWEIERDKDRTVAVTWLSENRKKETLGILIQKEHLESRVHSISLIYHFVFHYINQAAMNWQSIKNSTDTANSIIMRI